MGCAYAAPSIRQIIYVIIVFPSAYGVLLYYNHCTS